MKKRKEKNFQKEKEKRCNDVLKKGGVVNNDSLLIVFLTSIPEIITLLVIIFQERCTYRVSQKRSFIP